MVDREFVVRKMRLIGEDLERLAPIGTLPLEAYLADPKYEALAERYLERMIGRMIDVNYHVIVESGNAPPKDYHESFVRLGTLGILEAMFARQLASAAGLRNRIVHEYNELEEEKVYTAIQSSLLDIPMYLKQVKTYLDRIAGASDER